jgi:hypothetical protein
LHFTNCALRQVDFVPQAESRAGVFSSSLRKAEIAAENLHAKENADYAF